MINPFYMLAFSFLGVLATFFLKWSEHYQTLGIETYCFIFINILLNLTIGFLLKNKLKFKNSFKKVLNYKNVLTIIFFGYFINFLYAQEIPLINVIFGVGTYYKEINMIPTFYPLLVSLNVYFVLYYFYAYLITDNKTYLKTALMLLIPFLLNNGRGLLVMAITPCLLMYLSKNNIQLLNKKTYKVITLLLVFSFIFGFLGNIRSFNSKINLPTDYILEIGQATDAFRSAPIPKEYFWGYLYIVSPISNLDSFINSDSILDSSFSEFMSYNFLPQSVRKMVMDESSIDKKRFLVVDEFNVSTAYGIPFYQLGWAGVFFYQIIHFLLFFFLLLIVQKSYYKTIFLSLYSMMSMYSLFSNIWVLDAVFIPIMITVILSLKERIVLKKRMS